VGTRTEKTTYHFLGDKCGSLTLSAERKGPATRSRNRCQFDARLRCQFFVPTADARLLIDFWSRRQSTSSEVSVRREKLAPESGVEFMAPISGAGFGSVCHGPKTCVWLGGRGFAPPRSDGGQVIHTSVPLSPYWPTSGKVNAGLYSRVHDWYHCELTA